MTAETDERTILVVDDEEVTTELAKSLFTRHGFRVLVASDGEEALEVAESERPDLILLDVMLPKLDGFEVCRRLRSQDAFEKTPILMFTARGLTRDIERGKESGADEYIVKPFQGRDLVATIKKHLGLQSE
ncbi:response regulator [Candidatus Thorarchaeota archaeon]|nr:MAG: response regulator [Candidatus Thorarchaeota archaeon]